EGPVYNGMYTVFADAVASGIGKTGPIIIPSLQGNIEKPSLQNRDDIPWCVVQDMNVGERDRLLLSALLLAATGLVTGRKCATHWMAANDFRRMFPDVNLVEDKIITDEYGIYSSGGAFSYLNLILYLVEKYAGREIAMFCSKA